MARIILFLGLLQNVEVFAKFLLQAKRIGSAHVVVLCVVVKVLAIGGCEKTYVRQSWLHYRPTAGHS